VFEHYKVVCLTQVCRRQYLEILARYIVSSSIVDEYQLWRNSAHNDDSEYLDSLRSHSNKIIVMDCSSSPVETGCSIGQIYRRCVHEDTIYIRFDEDMVFLESDFFAKFLRFRIENPSFFLLFPNIINNPACTELQIKKGAIAPEKLHPWSLDRVSWRNPRFAEQLHRAFLECLGSGNLSEWHFGPHPLGLRKHTFECMAWFGKDFANLDGELTERNEEEWLGVIRPSELGRPNCIYGDAIVSHFAYPPQEKYLESIGLLSSYFSVPETSPAANSASSVLPRNRDIWAVRLLDVIRNITNASFSKLGDPDFVADQIRLAGLVGDNRFLYGSDNHYMNTAGAGLWQIPMQLARWLVQLSDYVICRVIDVGTWTGWTTAFLAAYLSRFNDHLHVTTIDVRDHFDCYPAIKNLLPIRFHVGKSADFRCCAFDLAFIDGDHTYDACRVDYDSVGRTASICAFHDINDEFVQQYERNQGGVPRFWGEIKSQSRSPDQVFEFLDHSQCRQVMGIGMIVRGSAVRRSGLG